MNEQHWEQEACPKYDCRKENCKCGMKKVFLATALGDDSEDSPIAPKNGAYCNAIVVYEANEHVYIYSTEGIPTLVESNGKEIEKLIKELEDGLAQEILDRQAADNALQQEIDDIKSSPDVVDIVATYAALQAYDTSHLGDNDIIRVLADETHDGQSTYYRWNKTTSTWTYIGAVGDYYTKGQVDNLLNGKQGVLTAGTNIQISAQNVISATDTTYSNFVGTDGVDPGTAGLVPAPATTDAGKFLKADGTWDTAGGGGDTVYSTKNTSNSANGGAVYIGGKNATQQVYLDPSSTDAHKRFFWALPFNTSWTGQNVVPGDETINIGGVQSGNTYNVTIGYRTACTGISNVNIGWQADSSTANGYCTTVGSSANSWSSYGTAIGSDARVLSNNLGSVALGADSRTTRAGEVYVGPNNTSFGYNNTKYRVIGGVHDPINAHDAATKGYVDANAGGAKALTTADYNWNKDTNTATEPYNAVALWLLPDGFYKPETESVYILAVRNGATYFSIANFSSFVDLFCVNTVDTKKYVHLFANNAGGMNRRIQLYSVIRVDSNGDVMYPYYDALPTSAVVNDLTWTLSGSALDARQGKVLKDLIDSSAIGTTETFTKATSDWTALAASSPYTYSTTVTLATTLSASSEVELINDQLVAFANYGFGILSITGQVATIASIGQPDSSITFKIKVRG